MRRAFGDLTDDRGLMAFQVQRGKKTFRQITWHGGKKPTCGLRIIQQLHAGIRGRGHPPTGRGKVGGEKRGTVASLGQFQRTGHQGDFGKLDRGSRAGRVEHLHKVTSKTEAGDIGHGMGMWGKQAGG